MDLFTTSCLVFCSPPFFFARVVICAPKSDLRSLVADEVVKVYCKYGGNIDNIASDCCIIAFYIGEWQDDARAGYGVKVVLPTHQCQDPNQSL